MIRVRAGQVIGRDHLARRVNCQDAFAFWQDADTVAAVVCDGCGSGAFSEVGARLGAQYLMAETSRLLTAGCSPAAVPARLYAALLAYLEMIAAASFPAERVDFVVNNLLFTVVGVVATPRQAVLFTAGDGLTACDGIVQQIEQGNAPSYPAYHLVPSALPASFDLQHGFCVQEVSPAWSQVAVASDGFEAALLPEVWGMAHPRGVQRRMNVWSDQQKRFRDDATLIVLEKQEAQPDEHD